MSDEVERVLAGEASYDTLDEEDRAVVRAEWGRRIARRLAERTYATELVETGEPWADADAEGRLVMREPGGDLPPW